MRNALIAPRKQTKALPHCRVPRTWALQHTPARWFFRWPFLKQRLAYLVTLFLLSLPCATLAQGPDLAKLFQEASDAQQRGDAALAVRKYQELLRLRPDVVAVRENLGLALVSLGRFDEAIAQYRAALALTPSDHALRAKLAMAYYGKGDLAEAASELSTVLKDEPGNIEIATLLGNCYVRLGRPEQAISLLSPLDEAGRGDLPLQLTLGWALVRAGRSKEGMERIDKLAQQTQSAEAYKGAAEAQLNLEAFDNARRDVEEALRLNPHLPGLYTLSGLIAADLGDYQGAAAAFEKELEADPHNFQAQFQLGAVLYLQRKLDAARAHLERALEIRPGSPQALYELARVKLAQGQAEAAVKDLERVERADPKWLEPRVELAALYYRLKRPQDGAREKQIVDRLAEEARQLQAKPRSLSPRTPEP